MELNEFQKSLIQTNSDMRIYEGYAGRNMFGKTTTGIVGEDTEIKELISNLVDKLERSEPGPTRTDISDLLKAVGGAQVDQMGKYNFIWY